jgi:hypothetical protein
MELIRNPVPRNQKTTTLQYCKFLYYFADKAISVTSDINSSPSGQLSTSIRTAHVNASWKTPFCPPRDFFDKEAKSETAPFAFANMGLPSLSACLDAGVQYR